MRSRMSAEDYDLSGVDEKYRPIVEILLEREKKLSDGYDFYSDDVIETLSQVAEEILEAITQ
jgi:hypothetical protein